MEPQAIGGLLARIMQAPEGGLLEFTPGEAVIIMTSSIGTLSGGAEILRALFRGDEFSMLGRRLRKGW